MKKLKALLATILTFTTGLGFYGIGLLAGALGSWLVLGWSHVAAGLVGAFVLKNALSITKYYKDLKQIALDKIKGK